MEELYNSFALVWNETYFGLGLTPGSQKTLLAVISQPYGMTVKMVLGCAQGKYLSAVLETDTSLKT